MSIICLQTLSLEYNHSTVYTVDCFAKWEVVVPYTAVVDFAAPLVFLPFYIQQEEILRVDYSVKCLQSLYSKMLCHFQANSIILELLHCNRKQLGFFFHLCCRYSCNVTHSLTNKCFVTQQLFLI